MPRLIVVFTSFYAFILALKKSGEVKQRDRHLCAEFQVRVVMHIIRVESSEEL